MHVCIDTACMDAKHTCMHADEYAYTHGVKNTAVTHTCFCSPHCMCLRHQIVTEELCISPYAHTHTHNTRTHSFIDTVAQTHRHSQTRTQGSPGLQCLAGVQCWSGSALENGRPCPHPINQSLPATLALSPPHHPSFPFVRVSLFLLSSLPFFREIHQSVYQISHAPPHLC